MRGPTSDRVPTELPVGAGHEKRWGATLSLHECSKGTRHTASVVDDFWDISDGFGVDPGMRRHYDGPRRPCWAQC
jgi:hypothetical protein